MCKNQMMMIEQEVRLVCHDWNWDNPRPPANTDCHDRHGSPTQQAMGNRLMMERSPVFDIH